MIKRTIGTLATAVASLLGSAAFAADATAGSDAKACYRPHCGKSIKGHEGKCGGTRIDDLKDEKGCTAAGGAWTTEVDAANFKKKS